MQSQPNTSRLGGRLPVLALGVVAALFAGPGSRAAAAEPLQAWAHPAAPATVRSAPAPSAAALARLRFTTELGNAEVYEVSARAEQPDGSAWLRIDVLGRPNGRHGWVPQESLGTLHHVNELLVISRSKLRATLLRNGRKVWGAPVGVGKAGTPTPAGNFYIREGTALGGTGGPYGLFAFGTSAYSPGLSGWPAGGVIGIHGTNQPELVPGRISHGCIRLHNGSIQRLRRLMGVGARLQIR
ncbi:MAG: L,D-transpeptidase family protein [Solirubrobacterales bacterium]